jgi:hypothetical protein
MYDDDEATRRMSFIVLHIMYCSYLILRCVNSRDAFESLLANDIKLSQKEFSEIMARLHCDKWIEDGPNNTVILHARAIQEMQSFIVDTYHDDIYHCQICTRLLIRGLFCSNR